MVTVAARVACALALALVVGCSTTNIVYGPREDGGLAEAAPDASPLQGGDASPGPDGDASPLDAGGDGAELLDAGDASSSSPDASDAAEPPDAADAGQPCNVTTPCPSGCCDVAAGRCVDGLEQTTCGDTDFACKDCTGLTSGSGCVPGNPVSQGGTCGCNNVHDCPSGQTCNAGTHACE